MFHYIYVMNNKINNKKYIGQTNDFHQRMNAHKSDAFNTNSHSYNTPLSNAIRKYGWNAFDNYVIEVVTEDWKKVDEREQYWIEYYSSLSSLNGYNITSGGQGCPRTPMTYEEHIHNSKLFTAEEIINIQMMLRSGEQSTTIREKYAPRLQQSYLDNINSGLNFKNPNWTYPLRPTETNRSNYFTTKEIELIKQDIKKGMTYDEIGAKWSISRGLISGINNGKVWYDKNEQYPLCIKGHSKIHNLNTWVKDVQEELMYGSLNQKEIAEKYEKAYSTIKKINSGASHHNSAYKYPLTSNRIQ